MAPVVSPIAPSLYPVTLGGQFRRHLPRYVAGTAMLGIFQLSLNRIDWLSKAAIDAVFTAMPERAMRPVLFILVLALVSFVARVASRWFISWGPIRHGFAFGLPWPPSLGLVLVRRAKARAFLRAGQGRLLLAASSAASLVSVSSDGSLPRSKSPCPTR
ncbi:MAG: hypothetical protein FWD69_19520 [Polyangiaceae bacterium]|nr:hypothetical protein [Polyangiaceae bacterium]